MATYRVIAPVVVAKIDGEHGKAFRHKQQGWTFEDTEVELQWLENHLRDGMVAKVADGAAPAAPPLPDKPAPEPPAPVVPRGRVKAAE